MKNNVKRGLVFLLAAAFTISAAACSGGSSETKKESSGGTTAPSSQKELYKIDVFSGTANFAGEQTGWFGKIVKDKFNLQLNIIASNLDGGGNKFATLMASGNIGDLIVFGDDKGDYINALKAGLILDWTKDGLLEKYGKDILAQFPKAIEKNKIAFGGGKAVYGIGSEAAVKQDGPSEGKEMTWGPDLRWDLYQKIGAPPINSPQDYLEVLKKMQEIEPKNEQGKPVYGFSFWSDWDSNYKMTLAKQFACMNGYDEIVNTPYLVAANDEKYYDMLSEESWYMKSLKLYFDANQMGLVDPDSLSQKFDDVIGKYKDGRVLFSWFPWLGAANYNTPERVNQGKGFALVPFKGEKIYSYGFNQFGGTWIMTIGAKAKHPERIMEFINWMYTPEAGMLTAGGGTSVPNGPKGLTWDVKDGKPYVTDFGWKCYQDPTTQIPAEYGGGTFKDGMNQINFANIKPTLKNPEVNEPYDHNLWTTTLNRNPSKLESDWRAKMGALTAKEYLVKNNMLAVSPQGFNGKEPLIMDKSLEQKNTQIGTVMQQYSWKMVFAKNEAEYNKLKQEMISKVKGLGYDEACAFAQKKAEELFEARRAAK